MNKDEHRDKRVGGRWLIAVLVIYLALQVVAAKKGVG
jgi:hypothetical protein